MNLVLLETSGNQRYIFATNKLRENVGASELTCRVGTDVVLQAVKAVTEEAQENDSSMQVLNLCEGDDLNGRMMRKRLLDPNINWKLEDQKCDVEIIIATSGKSLLLVNDAEIGKRIISKVTRRALCAMPGLTIHGAISKDFGDLANGDLSGIHEAVGEVHEKLELVRYQMPSNEQRFQRLSFVAVCSTSGLPASKVEFFQLEEKNYHRSAVTLAKLSAHKRYLEEGENRKELKRIEAVVKTVAPEVKLPRDLNKLEQSFKDLSWLAVIHADGNGVGEIFLNFNKYSGFDKPEDGRKYIDCYRRFSLALDVCTINAAGRSLEKLRQRVHAEKEEKAQQEGRSEESRSDDIPVVPLILGGDDLTMLCDGRYALKFTQDFLAAFEEETKEITPHPYLDDKVADETVHEILSDVIPAIAHQAFGVKRLSICAGIAIIKPHFPFHQAYELAEALLRSAKQVKVKVGHLLKSDEDKEGEAGKERPLPCSSLDYHILYDSSGVNLELIRARLRLDEEQTVLYAKPYIVTEIEPEEIKFKDDAKTSAMRIWCKWRKLDELEMRVAAMLAQNESDANRRKLPSSQLHDLREGLFLGRDEADARAKLISHRYRNQGFASLLCDEAKETLFFNEQKDGAQVYATHFMDALDIVEFRKGEKEENGKLTDKQSRGSSANEPSGSSSTAEQPGGSPADE